jgi:hypothetical protein
VRREVAPPFFGWFVQIKLEDGSWGTCNPTTDQVEARAKYEQKCADHPDREYRLIQETTRYELVEGQL